MARCPQCKTEIESDELDEFDVDIGDRLICGVCAANLEVVNVAPVELGVESDHATGVSDDDGSTGPPTRNPDEDDERNT